MSLPELKRLFPQLCDQLSCLNRDDVSQQSSASVLRCMRELLSDPCHMLRESLLKSDSGKEMEKIQLKKDALEDLKSLVSESAFKCAPRFPGQTPSLIHVRDKKSIILQPNLYPGYEIPKLGFLFPVSNHVMDASRTKVGLISRKFVEPGAPSIETGKVVVQWCTLGGEAKESVEELSKVIALSNIRVVISHSKKSSDDPISDWCVVKTAFTTSDPKPAEFVKFKDDNSRNEFVISRNSDDNDYFNDEGVWYEEYANMRQLHECHEYTILQAVARRLSASFDQLSTLSWEFQSLKTLKEKKENLEKKVKDLETKYGASSQLSKPTENDQEKEAKELKARWEEHEGTYERINHGNINVTELQFLDFN